MGDERATLDPDARDDAKQVLALAIAGIQRERAAADQYYARGRNMVTIVAALFAAVQAAFVANVGREAAGKLLLSSGERHAIIIPAIIGGVLLLVAVGALLFYLDRSRPMEVVGAGTLREIWIDPFGQHTDTPVLEMLAARAIHEEDEWSDANEDRRTAVIVVGVICALAAVAALAELTLLYVGLT